MINYCKNKNLENVGLHVEGCYPDKCELCQVNIVISDPVATFKKNKRIKNFYEDKKIEFRNESILANHWKENEKWLN